jgi:flagellar L-ring protein precursor FlgH
MTLGNRTTILLFSLGIAAALTAEGRDKKPPQLSPLDRYIQEALRDARPAQAAHSPGSLWLPTSRYTNLGGDIRATQVDDLITVLVVESASAVVNGATKAQRQASMSASVNALGGQKSPKGALVNLANVNSASQLDGQGTTSRSTSINTNLSARITHVLPNGYLVVEGSKEVGVNSEHQTVTVRGVVRPSDLSTDNFIRSDQIAQLELKVNGKGVVGDAVRRPFILYRLIMGLLPF